MQKSLFSFSSVASRSVSVAMMLSSLWSASGWAETPHPPAVDLTALRELKVEESRKNETGNQYEIGDRIPLYVSLPPDLATSGDALELKAPETGSKLEDQGWFLDSAHQFENGNFRFIVSPIQTGSLTLPTLVIYKNGTTAIARTSAYSVKVSGPTLKEKKSPELLEIIESGLPLKYAIILAFLTVVLASVAFFVFKRLRRKKKTAPIPTAAPVADPAYRIALRKIDVLYERYPYSPDNLKPVSFALSEILKEFFSARFKIEALESTTAEMISLLKREAVSEDSIREIRDLFTDLDLVKFTRRDNYEHFDSTKYIELKSKAQAIVQKWALETVT